MLDLDLSLLLKEYQNKNKALVLIEKNNLGEKKIYLKMVVQEKNITRNLKFKKDKLQENIIVEVKNQITNWKSRTKPCGSQKTSWQNQTTPQTALRAFGKAKLLEAVFNLHQFERA